jgi:hypothetical protein
MADDKIALPDEFLADIESRCLSDPGFPNRDTVLRLISEIRRLNSLLTPAKKSRSMRPTTEAPRCKAIRVLAGQPSRCAATAKYGEYCGLHKPRALKGKSKGCAAKSRSGKDCTAVVRSDNLCPSHWEQILGHDYERDGSGYRCRLCGQRFDYWEVVGKGNARKGSIKHTQRCPKKAK